MAHSKVRIQWILAFVCCAVLATAIPSGCYGEVIEHGTEEFCRLSGFVYHDLNNDGTRGPNEGLLPEIEVTLSGITLGGELFTLVASTGNTGKYYFENVPAGTYSVKETQPEILHTAMANSPGTAGGDAVGPNEFVNVQLDPGFFAENYNFGEWGLKAKYMTKRHFIVVVPEPATISMLCMLGAGIVFYWIRRRR